MEIRRAEPLDIEAMLPLFNAYRAFYKREAAGDSARAFLHENLELQRSIIFIAYDDFAKPVGFTQLYPRVSSLSMLPYIYISDLFVDPSLRKQGIAKKLMQKVTEYSTAIGANGIELETAHTNTTAQALYESLGYTYEQEYRTYYLSLLPKKSEVALSSGTATAALA